MKTTISGKFRVRLEEVAEEEEPLLDRVLNLVEAVGMFRLVLDGTRGVEEGADGRQRVVQLVVGCS